MSISETNLFLVQSERMTDYSDGGGKMTGVQVVDGAINNLFNDISQLDRTYGRVSLRKAYASVQTANSDTYLGAHIILTDPPADPNVNVTLFTTGSWTDERADAANQIESYTVEGPESNWILYGDHVIGQQMIRAFSVSNAASLNSPSPNASFQVGDVVVLSQELAGYTLQSQFVRITKIDSRITTQFNDGTDISGAYYKDVLIFEISEPLLAYYYGALVSRLASVTRPTLLRTVSIADAAQYFGVMPITASLAINDMTVQVASPYTALVPSANAETALVDVVAGMTKVNYKQAGLANALTVSASLAGTVAPQYVDDLYLGRGILPGSLVFAIGGTAYKDDGQGNVVLASGSSGSYGGTVDYVSGHIQITKMTSWSATVGATATAAVAIYDNAATVSIEITINNRAFNYVQTLTPVPSPGSLSLDYKALNQWYRLTDDGNGHLTGATGVGAGTIDYATGGVMVTLGALPDISSAVIFSWATPLNYTMQTSVLEPLPPQLATTLSAFPVAPSTLTISWTNGGSKTATANAQGIISGDATGTIVHQTGELQFSPALIAPAATTFNLAWSQNLAQLDTFNVTGDSSGTVTFTLTQNPVKPGSVSLSYHVTEPSSDGQFIIGPNTALTYPDVFVTRTITDNGSGAMLNEDGSVIAGSAINYSTGAITFDAVISIHIQKLVALQPVNPSKYSWSGGQVASAAPIYASIPTTQVLLANTTLTANYVLNSASLTTHTGSISWSSLQIDLTTVTNDDIIAGSVEFTFAGTQYFDRAGSIYYGNSALTNSATLAGTIDYQTGIVTLTNWVAGANTLTLQGLVTTPGAAYTPSVFFRTPGSPLATGQFQISAVTRSGDTITASADNNGDIISEWITGHIDWLSGVGGCMFGKLQTASTLPAQMLAAAWYNADNIDSNGKIFVPLLVKPETILFNTVLISYIPLNASILGIETVRLPLDGRVPIYRIGNVAVVHNTQHLTLSNPAVAGSVHDCGRTLLSYAKLYDVNGLIVDTSKFTANLDAGIVTLANPLDLTGYTQPLSIEHRIEDMSLITDVQITGQVKLMKPVRHAFPATTSFLSSALVIGDLQARYLNIFDQQTWVNAFSDTLSGSGATASYNDVLYPIVLTNAGAIQERWALVFTGTTAFSCYGEYSGLVAQGTTGANFAPINPITGVPYFFIDYHGWGAGWVVSNVLRFNTDAANTPLWLARTTLQSDPAVYTDNFKLQIRGDAN